FVSPSMLLDDSAIGSGSAALRAARRAEPLVQALQAEAQHEQEDTEHQRVDADEPGDRDRPAERPDRQGQAKQDRDRAAEDHPELALDMLAQANPVHDLEYA